MALSTTIEKARKDVEKTLSDPTPLYALAGVGDLAVEKARAAGNDIAARAAAFDAKAFGDKAQAKVEEIQAKIAARFDTLPDDVKAAPEQAQVKATALQAKAGELQAKIAARVSTIQDDVKVRPEQAQAKAAEFQTKAQAKAGEVVTDVVTAALTAYVDLAGRGKILVTRVRKQQETADLDAQVDATVSKVKAAKTTAKKSVKKTASSAKATKTTAKKSAATTKKAVKSATTSAKKSAAAAVDAVEATAEKIGD